MTTVDFLVIILNKIPLRKDAPMRRRFRVRITTKPRPKIERREYKIMSGKLKGQHATVEFDGGLLICKQEIHTRKYGGGESADIRGLKRWKARIAVLAEDLYKAAYGNASTVSVGNVEVEVEFVVKMPDLKTWKGSASFHPFDLLNRRGIIKINLTCNEDC